MRIHRGRRSNSVPRVSAHKYNLTASKSIDTTSLDRKNDYVNKRLDKMKDDELMAHKSPILHMMQITLNRKENMETFLCSNTASTTASTTDIEADPHEISKRSSDNGKTRKAAGKRVLKVQAKRFRMETKAAKTLAIIVGGFILCWLPFFTMYLIRAFCKTCIQPLTFSILFWLGYCNSAINPLIYALFSKEFRLAFKNLICKCLCAAQCKSHQQPVYHSANGIR